MEETKDKSSAERLRKILAGKFDAKETKDIPITTIQMDRGDGEIKTVTGEACVLLAVTDKGELSTVQLGLMGVFNPVRTMALIEALDDVREHLTEMLVKNVVNGLGIKL